MAVLDPFALDDTSDMQIQAFLTGQQSSVARCSKERKNFNFALFNRCHVLPRDLREHSSSTMTIELEVARRAITANTKVHNHRRRIGMVPTFDRRISLNRSERTIRIEIAGEATRNIHDAFLASAFRVFLRAAIYSRDTPRIAARRSHFGAPPKKQKFFSHSSHPDPHTTGTFARKMARTENHAKSSGEITGSRRFIEK